MVGWGAVETVVVGRTSPPGIVRRSWLLGLDIIGRVVFEEVEILVATEGQYIRASQRRKGWAGATGSLVQPQIETAPKGGSTSGRARRTGYRNLRSDEQD